MKILIVGDVFHCVFLTNTNTNTNTNNNNPTNETLKIVFQSLQYYCSYQY